MFLQVSLYRGSLLVVSEQQPQVLSFFLKSIVAGVCSNCSLRICVQLCPVCSAPVSASDFIFCHCSNTSDMADGDICGVFVFMANEQLSCVILFTYYNTSGQRLLTTIRIAPLFSTSTSVLISSPMMFLFYIMINES